MIALLGNINYSLIFDNSKIKKLVPGFTTTINFAEDIRKPLEYYMNTPELQIDGPDYNKWVYAVIAAQAEAVDKVRQITKSITIA